MVNQEDVSSENLLAAGKEKDVAMDEDHHSDEEGAIRYEDIYIPPPPATAFVANEDGSRLIITHIVNENFKSYAGIQELGPFHKYFTAIIGPNGSGKSNVIDSMLFVFGYHAKRLRSKKLSALLHDSAEHPKCPSCTVTVHFALMIDDPNDPEAYHTVPGSAFFISRTASADSSSYYTINGKRVLFKEIGKLLRSHGIDLDHNRFLILQGEVEQISLMKPIAENENETGMLEYLEDIIGSSRFKDPIDKLNKRVEEQNIIRDEKLNRFKMVDGELNDLRGPKDAALKYVQMENSIIELNHKLLQKKILMGQAEQEEKKAILTELEDKLKVLRKQLSDKKKEIQEVEKCNTEKSKELERLTGLKEKAKAAFEADKLRDMSLQTEIENANKKRKETTKLLASEEEKKSKLEQVPSKNMEEIAELENLEPKLEAERVAAQQKHSEIMASLQEDTQGLQDEKEKLQTELVQLRKTQDAAKSKLDMAKTELELYASQEENEKKKLDAAQTRLQDATSDLKKKEEEYTVVSQNLPKVERDLDAGRKELMSLKQEEGSLAAERRRCQLQLEESKVSMQATRGRGRVLDALMKEKVKGTLPGIFGRMGDLGGIDAKYDVAISTACGPLDNIVVDTVDTATKCIEFLKKNNIGSATFVALEKQERFRSVYSQPFHAPENVPRLFDLVKVADERIRPVFYFALQDTVVASDLDQATRIAYGHRRYRVVTLTGELIELAGTMSGGGNSVLRGRMGRNVEQRTCNVDPREVERMERNLAEAERKLHTLSERMTVLEENVARWEAEVKTMRQRKSKLDVELAALKEQTPMLRQQIKAQEAKVKEATCDPKKLASLNKTVTEMRQQYERESEASGVIEAKVNKLHTEIIAKTKGRVESAQKKLDEVTGKLEKVRKEKTKLKVAITTAERNVKKCQEKIENMKQEIESCVERIKKCAAEIKNNEAKAAETLAEFEKYESELKELQEMNSETKSTIEELLSEENQLKSKEIDMKKEVTQSKAELDQRTAKVNTDKKRLESLKLLDEACDSETVQELRLLSPEEVEALNLDDIMDSIRNKEGAMPKQKPNLGVIQEYNKKHEVMLEKLKDLDDATNTRNKTRDLLNVLKKNRLMEFIKGFNVISLKVKECYQMLAEGGDADLELVNTMDPFLDGIKFSVRPPKKSWKDIQFLSGGEKTLSSLSLIFALHYYKPTPLYFMDEIDAALDWKNTAIVGYYLKEQTRNAQLIIVSLRENMFELADQLVGIFKTHNCTKSVTIVPRLYSLSAMENAENQEQNAVSI